MISVVRISDELSITAVVKPIASSPAVFVSACCLTPQPYKPPRPSRHTVITQSEVAAAGRVAARWHETKSLQSLSLRVERDQSTTVYRVVQSATAVCDPYHRTMQSTLCWRQYIRFASDARCAICTYSFCVIGHLIRSIHKKRRFSDRKRLTENMTLLYVCY